MNQVILVVEDDQAIAAGLALNLRIAGYQPQVANDGDAALARWRDETPALVLLDISLPMRSGLDVLNEMRQAGDRTPVIVLSARQDEFDKVAALRLGADDYVTKPFALAELLARVDAVLRRAGPGNGRESPPAPKQPALRFADVVVDLDRRKVTRRGAEVELTHLELELLIYLLRNPSKVLSREQLLREVWGLRHSGSRRTVDNFIAQLRAKLEREPEAPRNLLTVRGSGYRFEP